MIALDHKPGTPQWTAYSWTGVELSHVFNGHADEVLRAAGVGRVTVNDAQLSGVIASSTTKTDPPSSLTPSDRAEWVANRG